MRIFLACSVAVALAAPCFADVEVLVGDPAGRVAREPDPALVNEPFAVAFDAEGRMYGVEFNRGNRLFRVSAEGTVEFVADTFNHQIRSFDPETRSVAVVAGTGLAAATAATAARATRRCWQAPSM